MPGLTAEQAEEQVLRLSQTIVDQLRDFAIHRLELVWFYAQLRATVTPDFYGPSLKNNYSDGGKSYSGCLRLLLERLDRCLVQSAVRGMLRQSTADFLISDMQGLPDMWLWSFVKTTTGLPNFAAAAANYVAVLRELDQQRLSADSSSEGAQSSA